MKTPLKINLVAPYISADGFGHITEQMLIEFSKRDDVEIILTDEFWQMCDTHIIHPRALKIIRGAKTNPKKGDITLNIYPPYVPWKRYDNPMAGYTMWETSKIPQRWKQKMNQADIILTPCKFNKDVFKDCGVIKPIEVVPLGVEENRCEYNHRGGTKFIVGFMATNALEDQRKNVKAVLQAYNFIRSADTELWIKTRSTWLPKELNNQQDVKIISETKDKRWLDYDFFDKIHCFAYPTRGEGYGLPPAEAMSRGCVTMVTSGGGGDYVQEPYCIPMPSKKIPVDLLFGNFEYVHNVRASEIGDWRDVDVLWMTTKMDAVYRDWKYKKFNAGENMGRAAVSYMKGSHTYQHTVDKMIWVLSKLVK